MEVKRWIRPVNGSQIESHTRYLKTISVEDVYGGMSLEIFMWLPLIDSLPFLVDRLGPAITRRENHAFLWTNSRSVQRLDSHPCATFLHPLILSLPRLYSLPLFAFPSTAHTHKTNYNTAKPIWEQQASHSAGEGGWNACCHKTSKLQHVKPRPIACPVAVGSLISNVHRPNHPGNPFVIVTYFSSVSLFWWLRHVEVAISVHQTRRSFSLKRCSNHKAVNLTNTSVLTQEMLDAQTESPSLWV